MIKIYIYGFEYIVRGFRAWCFRYNNMMMKNKTSLFFSFVVVLLRSEHCHFVPSFTCICELEIERERERLGCAREENK